MSSSTTKAHLVRDRLLDGLRRGTFGPGERLPSERSLAKELGLNHQTVRRALAELAKDGLITRQSGVGSFVAPIQPRELSTQVAILLPRWLKWGPAPSLGDGDGGRSQSGAAAGQFSGEHPFLQLLLPGLVSLFDPRRYQVTPLFYCPDRFWFEVGEITCARRTKGALFVTASQVSAEDIRRLVDHGVKTVLLGPGRQFDELGLTRVWVDSDGALAQALAGLAQLGHRRIVVGRYALPPGQLIETIRACEARYGLDVCRRVVEFPNAQDEAVSYAGLASALDQRPRPTAVVVADEFAAAEVFRLARARGLRVPQDISVAALHDNLPHSHPVPLTAMDSPAVTRRLAEVAVRCLTELLEGPGASSVTGLSVRSDLVWRGSTGPCPTE